MAADEGASVFPPTLRVQRVRGREEKVEQLATQQQERRQAREQHQQSEQSTSDFDAAITQARRHGTTHKARMRERPAELTPTYFRHSQRAQQQKAEALSRWMRILSERHSYSRPFRADAWLDSVLRELEHATPTDPAEFRPCMKTVRLPDGVRAVFKGNAGEAILEIMQRTGSHLQMLPARHDSGLDLAGMGQQDAAGKSFGLGFQSLSLWGTPSENAAAVDLLPNLVDTVTLGDVKASKDSRDTMYPIEGIHRFGSLVSSTDRMHDKFVDKDTTYWRTQDPQYYRKQDGDAEQTVTQDEDCLRVDADDCSSEQMPIRAYWIRTEVSLDSVLVPVADGDKQANLRFKRPAVWTTVVFTDYIETLAALPPRLVRRRMRAKSHVPGKQQTDTAKEQIIAEMFVCFSDTSALSCISSEAVDVALSFFAKHGEYPGVRSLLEILQSTNRYSLTASNFDVLLIAAAAAEDVHNFQLWLRKMLHNELRPTARTWVSVHQLICRRYPGTLAPSRVLNAMQQKGVLTNVVAMREVVKYSVEHEFTAHLERDSAKASLDDFVEGYDARYRIPPGHHFWSSQHKYAKHHRPWLSVEAANIMAKVLLSHGRTQDAIAVLRMLEESGERLRIDALNTFLAATYRARDPSFAVSVLKHFEPALERASRGLKPDLISYNALFRLAWRKQCYNMLRVIWRYACCAGEVPWRMQRRVEESLLSYVPAGGSTLQLRREGDDRRLVEEQRSLLKGSAAMKSTVGKEVVAMRSRRAEVFFGWVGKFVVGVTDGVLGGQKDRSMSADGSNEDDAAAVQSPLHHLSDAAEFEPLMEGYASPLYQGLTDHKAEVLALSAQSRTEQLTEDDDQAHRNRKARLHALLHGDLSETMSLRPTVPFVGKLEQAWQKDMRWKARGLGLPDDALQNVMTDRTLGEKQKAEVFAKAFRGCLEHGITVPVVVGSALRR